MFCFQCLSHPRIVSTEHLRSVFFHACERLPPGSWQEDQLAALTMYLVDELFHAFVNGSLPNYFLPEEDLLAGIDDDFLWEVQRRLVDMRTKALWFFLDFTRAFRFSWTPVITESFAENIKNTLVGKQSITNVGACLQSILVPLVMSLGTAIASPCLEPEGNDVPIDKAMEFIIYGLKVIRDCTGLDVSLDAILNIFIMAPKSALLRIRLLEYVIQRCPNSPEISSFYGNLACMYHVHYWELDTNERKELHTKIDQTFQKAISHTESGAATMTDYANFLCRMGDWEEAIPKLHEAIKKDADHSQGETHDYISLNPKEPLNTSQISEPVTDQIISLLLETFLVMLQNSFHKCLAGQRMWCHNQISFCASSFVQFLLRKTERHAHRTL